MERLAELEHIPAMGFHSIRRKFASELKEMPLSELMTLGGWKDPNTVVKVYQRPSISAQREGLAARKKVLVGA